MRHHECWARLFLVVEPEMLRAYIVYAFVVTFTAEGAEKQREKGSWCISSACFLLNTLRFQRFLWWSELLSNKEIYIDRGGISNTPLLVGQASPLVITKFLVQGNKVKLLCQPGTVNPPNLDLI